MFKSSELTRRCENRSVDDDIPQVGAGPAGVTDSRLGQDGAVLRTNTSGVGPTALTRSDKFRVQSQFRKLFVLEGLDELGVEASEAGPEGEEGVEQVEDALLYRL